VSDEGGEATWGEEGARRTVQRALFSLMRQWRMKRKVKGGKEGEKKGEGGVGCVGTREEGGNRTDRAKAARLLV